MENKMISRLIKETYIWYGIAEILRLDLKSAKNRIELLEGTIQSLKDINKNSLRRFNEALYKRDQIIKKLKKGS